MHKEEKILLTEELADYMRQEPVLCRLLKCFRQKYESYGSFSGKIVLRIHTSEERDVLEGFLGRNLHGQKSATVSADQVRKVLEEGRYREVTPEQLLEVFFGTNIIGKGEQKARIERKKQQILQKWEQIYEKTPVMEVKEEFLRLVKLTGEEFKLWEKNLSLGAEIYNQLPYREEQQMYLAVFAAKLTGSPHSFDVGTSQGKFLYQIVQLDLKMRNMQIKEIADFPAYQRQHSFLKTGIMIDDVSNYAMLYGVRATKADGNEHLGVEGFRREQQILQVSLAIISQWKNLYAVDSIMYVVENPSVFAMLCAAYPEKSFMCMNGQPRLASLLVLGLLAKTGTKLFYGGDLDPEGLLIAQKLKRFYPGQFEYWHMSGRDYLKACSREVISDKRLSALDQIQEEDLQQVKDLLKKEKLAAYQEKLNFDLNCAGWLASPERNSAAGSSGGGICHRLLFG